MRHLLAEVSVGLDKVHVLLTQLDQFPLSHIEPFSQLCQFLPPPAHTVYRYDYIISQFHETHHTTAADKTAYVTAGPFDGRCDPIS